MLRRFHGPLAALALSAVASTIVRAQDPSEPAASPPVSDANVQPPTSAAPPQESGDVVPPTTQPPTNGNPFRLIPARNAFGIKDPPPPPTPVVETPPPPPPTPSNVTLTGFSLWQGRKKVYLQISAPGSKAPSYRDMEEGDIQDDIEILGIDEKNETARIRNAGQEFTLNFKENGAKPTGGPQQPGVPTAPGTIPAPVTTGVVNATRGSGPTVIGRGGVTDSSDPSAGMPIPAPAAGSGGAVATSTGGGIYPTLPSRRNRTDAGGASTPSSAPVVQPGQERVINGRVIPPPPPLPVFDVPISE